MKHTFLFLLLISAAPLFAQHQSARDSIAFMDSIFSEMDEILNEMMPRKNYFSAAVGIGTGFFNFKNLATESFDREKKLMLSPSLNFLHKSGAGISTTGYAVSSGKLNFYQASITPSYDYIKRGKWSAGVAYTKYFTKKDLDFYTTPISNELSAYFLYKKAFVKPGISLAYGWGSRTQYEERKVDIMLLRKKRNPRVVIVANEESIRDISTMLTLRKDFDFTSIFSSSDLFTLTPVLALSAGTQNFGLNTSFSSNSKKLNNFLPGNQNIEEQTSFDFQSTSVILRADYSIKKFFIQSQFLLDYYLHSTPGRFNNAFAVIAGVNL